MLIKGNTYPVKEQLKALGGRWDAGSKGWIVPEGKAQEARALVEGAAAPSRPVYSANFASNYRRTGCRCGSRDGLNRDSDCAQCRYDNE